MSLFDNLFGKKKSEQDADVTQAGEVNAPLSADNSASDAATPAIDTSVQISNDGEIAPPPAVVTPETPTEPEMPAETPAAESTPQESSTAVAEESTPVEAPVEATEEVVQPGESNLETPTETETPEEKVAS